MQTNSFLDFRARHGLTQGELGVALVSIRKSAIPHIPLRIRTRESRPSSRTSLLITLRV